jgi:hypothetical protein
MALTLAFQPALVLLGDLGYQAYSMFERVEIWQRFHVLAQP